MISRLLVLVTLASVVSALWEQDFASPNSWLASVVNTYPPGLGEPLNVVVSSRSSAEALTRDGFKDWLNSVGYADECLGLHAGNKQSADLNDWQGLKEQDGLYRWAYGLVDHGGSCYESLNGGSHVRYWFQETTGSIFMAVSNEMNAAMNHDIVPNGYDLGRDMLVGLANASLGTTSPSSGVVYSATSTFASGLINSGFDGVNHGIATDGLVAIINISVVKEGLNKLTGSAIPILISFLLATLIAAGLAFFAFRPSSIYSTTLYDVPASDIHARRHHQLLLALGELRRAESISFNPLLDLRGGAGDTLQLTRRDSSDWSSPSRPSEATFWRPWKRREP